MPSPLEWIVFQKHDHLPKGDPEDYLTKPQCRKVWTAAFKAKIRQVLVDTSIDHFGPTSCWDWLPLATAPWKPKHKALAIMCMRITHGQFWLCDLKRMPDVESLDLE